MLTKTTVTAIRTLMYVGLHPGGEPMSIRTIAESLGESPTYLAKVTRHLVKAGILRAHLGVSGGIELNRQPTAISLRAIVEACQGLILGDFCQDTPTTEGVCAFHAAALELHEATIGVLERWTLDHFICRPEPSGSLQAAPCLVRPRVTQALRPSGKKPPRRPSARKSVHQLRFGRTSR